ncbi:26S proteasome regulatory subunit 4 [Podospora fimiseda]|uniref:26S proteasome regulatory subunit 4 n=1 Tax=Podospora fimiseda TaxID=252190 RepID=A0AAN7GND0_9PEZI|nr:26S proteasome regulatory subunit 4 [Podospora fimiseda]
MDDTAKNNVTNKLSRVAYVDQVFDHSVGQTRQIKTVKASSNRNKRKILVVRRIFDIKGIYERTEVEIHSDRLAKVLREINTDVEGITLLATPPKAPLQIFYHNTEAFNERLRDAKAADPIDESLVEDLQVAVDFVDDEFRQLRDTLAQLLPSGEITWDLLWTLFPPNSLVYRRHQYIDDDQILKVRSIHVAEDKWDKSKICELNCHVVTDDGVKFGRAIEPFWMYIPEYLGSKPIADLRIFPLKYHPDADKIRAMAVERGRRFVKLKPHQLVQTSGAALSEKRDKFVFRPFPLKLETYGRAIIDPVGFRAFNPQTVFRPTVIRSLARDLDQLSEEDLIIITPVTLGFCFGIKKWAGFSLSRLVDVTWNEQAFNDLVLDNQKKMLVHSMIKQHSWSDNDFDDIISGKGKGLIGLFSGPPGCGKTLTAEAVAEVTKRPLYNVSAGELGVKPDVVDQKLTGILELAHKWNAVLLLDEADVFLHERDQENVQRNALVSIFLRQLEYYQGILILTTNRLSTIDPAFESRIHISVEYPELDGAAKRQVWTTFLKRARGVTDDLDVNVTEEEIDGLARIDINGRKIKNIVSGARSIAKERNEPLSTDLINLVLRVSNARITKEPTRINGHAQ